MNLANPTILLVDEQPSGVDALLAYLEDTDYAAVTARNGLSAWEMLASNPDRYDAVILDRGLSGLDGIQVLERMQRHPILQDMPAILQTGSTDQHRLPDGLECGIRRCLPKPFDQAQLLAVLAKVLKNRVCYRSDRGAADLHDGTLGLMREATFTFKTPDSARELAALLASTCPEPQRVVVGLAELLLNAVEHGNLRISYEEKGRLRRDDRWDQEVTARLADPAHADKEVWVEFAREPSCIRVRIRDQGDGFDWRRHREHDPAKVAGLHGRGIAIARLVSFDSIEYRGSGNEVEVRVDIPARG